ncbi:GGDEF domain-containing protein [Marinobacter sp. SS21]|uniref:GGDEF domain-containing protein n=1 Tax=Marinobacter sp. SS21 TaxID=2979460 RepID=UPI002331081B|nr:GGDEF domain-containing protein [Marinobacter sp. SS21]MDC0663339.1 GGDEF domain-containing protein [Marinobacter sp. SS21]
MSNEHHNIRSINKQGCQLSQIKQAAQEWHDSGNPYVRVTRRLTTTLSLEEVIALFADELMAWVPHDQLTYRHRIGRQDFIYSTGLGGQHRCEYKLGIEGEPLGTLTLTRRSRFHDEELTAIEQMLAVAVCPIRNACLYTRVQQAALTDALTSVPNKRALDEALAKACCISERHSEHYSLILCDLDHFKHINDSFGHVIGDHILKAVAREIEQAVRHSDSLFRFGGEEFAVLLPYAEESDARVVAERIRQRIADLQVCCGERQVTVTCSLGIATWHTGDQPERWLARADEALYRAKRHGRNQTQA